MDRSATQISLTLCDLVFPSPKCCKFSVLLWACVCVCVCRVIVVVSLIRPTRSFSQLYWAFQVFLVAREVQTKNWLNYVKHPQWHLFWLCICVSVYLCICVLCVMHECCGVSLVGWNFFEIFLPAVPLVQRPPLRLRHISYLDTSRHCK